MRAGQMLTGVGADYPQLSLGQTAAGEAALILRVIFSQQPGDQAIRQAYVAAVNTLLEAYASSGKAHDERFFYAERILRPRSNSPTGSWWSAPPNTPCRRTPRGCS